MREVTEFIKKAGTFYLGTTDGDQPEIRPIGVFQEYDGKLYTAVGKHKKVFAQIEKNPKVVICAMSGTDWVRLRAVAKLAPDEIVARLFADNPFLTSLYNETSGLQLGVLMKDENLEPLLKKYAFSDAEDIYGAVGYGMIAAAYVITRLYEEQQKAEEAAAPKAPPALPEVGESAAARTGKPTQGIYVEGGSGMLVRFARCCNPVPGDDIVGYITRGRGVTVHKADCVNAQHSEPERAIRVSWAEESIGRFTTTIQVIAYDHPSLLGELTVFVQDGGAPISAMSVKISKNKTCTIQMEVQVESREKLDAVLARIRKRPDVIEAFRLGR